MVSKTSTLGGSYTASKGNKYPHYDVIKPNEQHQFDLLYMPHNVFEGNTYKYILTGADVASRCKGSKTLWNKKSSDIAFVLEAINLRRVVCFNTQRYFKVIKGLSSKVK